MKGWKVPVQITKIIAATPLIRARAGRTGRQKNLDALVDRTENALQKEQSDWLQKMERAMAELGAKQEGVEKE